MNAGLLTIRLSRQATGDQSSAGLFNRLFNRNLEIKTCPQFDDRKTILFTENYFSTKLKLKMFFIQHTCTCSKITFSTIYKSISGHRAISFCTQVSYDTLSARRACRDQLIATSQFFFCFLATHWGIFVSRSIGCNGVVDAKQKFRAKFFDFRFEMSDDFRSWR